MLPTQSSILSATPPTNTISAPQVIATKGARHVTIRYVGDRRHFSIVFFVNAAGGALLPVIILTGSDTPRGRKAKAAMMKAWPEALYIMTESGNMTEEAFGAAMAMRCFVRSTGPDILLLLDGHASRVSIDAIAAAREGGVSVFTLPAHSSHATQPVDVGVARPFKAELAKAVQRIQLGNAKTPGEAVTSDNIMKAVKIAFNNVTQKKVNPETGVVDNAAVGGFRGAGPFPFMGKISDPKMSEVAIAIGEATSGEQSPSRAAAPRVAPSSDARLAAVQLHTKYTIAAGGLDDRLKKEAKKRAAAVPAVTLLTGDAHVEAVLASVDAKASKAAEVVERREKRRQKKAARVAEKEAKRAAKAAMWANAVAPVAGGKRKRAAAPAPHCGGRSRPGGVKKQGEVHQPSYWWGASS